MNYHYRRTTCYTVRLAFELTTPYHDVPHRVWRIRDDDGIHHFTHEGLVLDHSVNQTRVAVVNVRPGDVVMISYRAGNAGTPPHQGYRIDETFEPIPIADVGRFWNNMSSLTLASPVETHDGTEMRFGEDDLKKFLSAKHPKWLADHVKETLQSWREEAPNTYVDHAPREWLDRDALMLAIYAPQRVLSDFRHLLTPDIEAFCIHWLTLPEAEPVSENLPPHCVRVKRNAMYVLQNHLHQLSNEELRRCAKVDPVTAYRARHLVTDDKRAAILLATSFGVAWHTDRYTLGPRFRREVFQSITKYPAEWLESNPGFPHIFGRLGNHLGIRFNDKAIALMLRRIAPAGRGPLCAYIASKI